MTPLQERVLDPPSYGTFSTPLRCQHKSLRQSRPEALLEGSKNFRESAFSGTFSSPHTFCTPHIMAQQNAQRCLRRVPKLIWCLWSESPERVSRTMQTCFAPGGQPQTGLRAVQQTVLGLWARRPENTFHTLFKHIWAFSLF